MIQGKLNEMERDPKNVQVVVGATGLSLWGEDGEFLAIADQPSEDTRPDSDCNRYSEMSEVPPTVSYADADGYHCYPLNTTCTQSNYLMLTLLHHALATTLHHTLQLYYVTVQLLSLLFSTSSGGAQMVWIHSVILHLALCAALR